MLVSDISLGEVVLDKCGVRMIPITRRGSEQVCNIWLFGDGMLLSCFKVQRFHESLPMRA